MLESPVAVPDPLAPHEHLPTLVEVSYDDLGRAVHEFACSTCSSVWFA